MTDKEFELLLKDAVCEMHKKELDDIPDNKSLKEEYYPLSKNFYLKMNDILKKNKQKHKTMRWLQNVAAAIFVVIVFGLVASPEINTRARFPFMKWFDKYANFKNENEESDNKLKEYVINYIPEGFENNISIYNSTSGILEYSNENEHFKLYYSGSDGEQNWDNEKAKFEVIVKEGLEIFYWDIISDNTKHMVWEKDGITFSLRSTLNKQEMLKIQESIQEKSSQ